MPTRVGAKRMAAHDEIFLAGTVVVLVGSGTDRCRRPGAGLFVSVVADGDDEVVRA
ncbi:hypothetical protein [Streptomyces sp. NPDC058457]|uniref:hypothetical protein n=1 Tax=Streptomyces sp. NPDC058457 TaxID=3346507 RepID=UPI00364C773B